MMMLVGLFFFVLSSPLWGVQQVSASGGESGSMARGHYVQTFRVANKNMFSVDDLAKIMGLYESFTERFEGKDAEESKTSFRIHWSGITKPEDGEPGLFIATLKYAGRYHDEEDDSSAAHLKKYPAAFLEYVNDNLPTVASDMQGLGLESNEVLEVHAVKDDTESPYVTGKDPHAHDDDTATPSQADAAKDANAQDDAATPNQPDAAAKDDGDNNDNDNVNDKKPASAPWKNKKNNEEKESEETGEAEGQESDATSTATTSTSSATLPDDGGENEEGIAQKQQKSNNTGLIVGIVVGVVAVVVIAIITAVVVCRRRRRRAISTATGTHRRSQSSNRPDKFRDEGSTSYSAQAGDDAIYVMS